MSAFLFENPTLKYPRISHDARVCFKTQQIFIYQIMMNISAAMAQSVQWLADETEYRRIFVRFLVQARGFSSSETFIPSPGPTLLLFNVCQRIFFRGKSYGGLKLTTFIYCRGLRIRGAIPPVRLTSSWPIYWQYRFTHDEILKNDSLISSLYLWLLPTVLQKRKAPEFISHLTL